MRVQAIADELGDQCDADWTALRVRGEEDGIGVLDGVVPVFPSLEDVVQQTDSRLDLAFAFLRASDWSLLNSAPEG